MSPEREDPRPITGRGAALRERRPGRTRGTHPRPAADVDPELLRNDPLWDGVVNLLFRHPSALPGLVPALTRGRSAARAYVIERGSLDVATLPRRAGSERAATGGATGQAFVLVETPAEAARPLPRWRAWLRAIRPLQWSKNLLLVLPAVAAHLALTPALLLELFLGFVAFSSAASAVYLINDLADLPHDRRHATKCRRPLASGDMSIPAAFVWVVALLAIAAAVTLRLPREFQLAVLGYFALTTAYSFALKRRLLVDVFCLATLYAARVVAGGLLTGVALSDWFIAFFIFIFLSLALIKRVDELRLARRGSDVELAGRGYRTADLPVLTALGTGAGVASAVVYCLFIASADSEKLYRHPTFLWMALPVILYWQARMWVLAARGAIEEDPVLFAAHDRVTYWAVCVMALLLWLSS